MPRKQILVLGGGFAGLWSAVGAARKVNELQAADIDITLVNRDEYHSIRVRNYESDLSDIRTPLGEVLGPIGVNLVVGKISNIDFTRQIVDVDTAAGLTRLTYDRLVFALGSQVYKPAIPGLAELGFDVDTFDGAAKLDAHLRTLAKLSASPAQGTVLVVGSGLTGIEVATEMPSRLQALNFPGPHRVILADRNSQVGSDMGDSARPIIESALKDLGIETRLGIDVVTVDQNGVQLRSGETIAAATVIWCAGMRANPLTRLFPVERDFLGRVPVDSYLKTHGVANVFVAGDSAWMRMDGEHQSVMSCQHGRPEGRFAGHNVVCDLLGLPMLPLHIDWYVTVLDLGPWGAVYTEGWDRHVVSWGESAKATKRTINRERIYPPRNRDRAAIFAAAAPVVQRPPGKATA